MYRQIVSECEAAAAAAAAAVQIELTNVRSMSLFIRNKCLFVFKYNPVFVVVYSVTRSFG